MKKVKADNAKPVRKMMPALTPEAREAQLVMRATDLAEQQLIDGTASSQVITHFLKLGSQREQLEREKIRNENLVLEAKAKAYESAENMETLYKEAINAMKGYTGHGEETYED